ncbi:ATP-binding cassette domain-containing protein [Methylophilus sp. VKM B-3414]|uniref:ATP-binding cassette domain-containing protein n=1 Tax=Methylophilus sp. VKM B-3414 TaxID=3076121 RepID=UPI0028C8DD52|nr:ATP-binding cassette domain-containing protein [Methylophilus sp. VKM B-3414]MDT7849139.1 ATP-binding cassette domain-containing protein [Methylophilus sp. VKM B-3414]
MSHRAAHLLKLQAVTLKLGGHVFGPFSMTVQPGERIAVLGPSGAGKSTLLKLLAGEHVPSGGQVRLRERCLTTWSLVDLSRQRAILPQSHEVAFGLPVELVIGLGRVARMVDPDLNVIVRQAAELACARHLLPRRFDTLSGGEKARVHLARVFAQLWDIEQGLLLVDEPMAALDPGLQWQLMAAMDQFARQRGHAIFAILHDINQALQGFDRLVLIKDGRLIGDYPRRQIVLSTLAELYEVNLVSAVTEQGQTLVAPERLTVPSVDFVNDNCYHLML